MAIAEEEWAQQVVAIMNGDPDLQPPPEELPGIVDQARKAIIKSDAVRVLTQFKRGL